MSKTKKQNKFRIKPAARHILTIGKDLIKDSDTALLELVKNSYDADAKSVRITFATSEGSKTPGIMITVADDGHGMEYKTVTEVWMVPSTAYKSEQKISEGGRPLQGRKGIGRYAASILGDELQLETTRNKETTTLSLDWRDFEREKYLEDVEVEIDRKKTGADSGTTIEIVGDNHRLTEWGEPQIRRFITELRRLVSPIAEKEISSDFKIRLSFIDFPVAGYENLEQDIEPLPVLEFFDYRISGIVSVTGKARLIFENGTEGVPPEPVNIDIHLEEGAQRCGPLKVDFKIYDRDTESIENLITKIFKKASAKDKSIEKLSKTDTRALLNEISGIAVYRGGFRIRPHGDPGYDWMELDRTRVQRPGVRVGSERVSGYIEIAAEEVSHLEEKANRDGLKENLYFEGLVQTARRILLEAEIRRYGFKQKTGKDRSKKNIGDKLDNLFDFSDVRNSIDKALEKRNVPKKDRQKVLTLMDEKVQESNRVIEDVKQIIAIYQGQATLGKIVKVVLHEGRNPLSYFQNQIPEMEKWADELKKNFTQKLLDQFLERLAGVKRQTESLVRLFGKISPLAAKRRSVPSTIKLKKELEDMTSVFAFDIKEKNVEVVIECDDKISISAWKDDFSQAFINLIDNSLYWLTVGDQKKREITMSASAKAGIVRITYKDNGPGIEEKFIRDQLIFEPGFTTRPNGTGLGLAIAGEAMERSGGKLGAVYSESGAHFEIELPEAKA